MTSNYRQYSFFILAVAVFALVHEGVHATAGAAFDEYEAFHVRPYGFEVELKTPVADREGVKWGFISGSSNVLTILFGYMMFSARKRISASGNAIIRRGGYYLTVLFLLSDPLNLSVGSFIYGGDIGGIVVGFGIHRWIVQIGFFFLVLFNRELIAQRLLPAFCVETRNIAFRPWIRLKFHSLPMKPVAK